jgi:hypothetical protein
MANRLTKAILASSPNVVPLPSAARRQVNNSRFSEQRKASSQARKASRFKERYIQPFVRAELPDAAALLLVEHTPELLLSIAMFEALTEEQRKQVRDQCEMLKFTGPAARGAAVLTQVRTIGDSTALDAAMKLLRERDIG